MSIYNQNVQRTHPLLGLKFKNTSGAHLNQGPVTVFEGSVYVWNTRNWEVTQTIDTQSNFLTDIVFCPVQKKVPIQAKNNLLPDLVLATSSWDRTVKLWHFASGKDSTGAGHDASASGNAVTSAAISGRGPSARSTVIQPAIPVAGGLKVPRRSARRWVSR